MIGGELSAYLSSFSAGIPLDNKRSVLTRRFSSKYLRSQSGILKDEILNDTNLGFDVTFEFDAECIEYIETSKTYLKPGQKTEIHVKFRDFNPNDSSNNLFFDLIKTKLLISTNTGIEEEVILKESNF